MAPNQDQITTISGEREEESVLLKAMQTPSGLILCRVVITAIDLGLFDIMAKAGSPVTASDIASRLPTKNQEASVMLDRMLRFLANQSYLLCDLVTDQDGHLERLYSLAPVSKAYVEDQDGVSLSPLLFIQVNKDAMEPWYHLKETILEGGLAYQRAHGMQLFDQLANDGIGNEEFNKAMHNHTKIVMKKVLEVYKGFEGINEIMDVGGGLGTSLTLILSKYPQIKAINFDLPHVIKSALSHPGIEHVAGDMFKNVPKAEAIFMKWILHDWSDEQCIKLLKNCREALPESGKMIIVDALLPEYPKSDATSTVGFIYDLYMMVTNHGGKERTRQEVEALATKAGFASFIPVCPAYDMWVMEFHKKK